MFVSAVSFWEPNLLMSRCFDPLTIPFSLLSFSVRTQEDVLHQGHRGSQPGAQVRRFEDFLRCCSYSPVDFMFLHFRLVDFDRLPCDLFCILFNSCGINLGFLLIRLV